MSLARLAARTPSARPLGMASLSHHELRFHKAGKDLSAKCDAFFTGVDHHQVLGVLYHVHIREMPLLDRYEGLGNGYEKKEIWVKRHDDELVQAVTYYATHIEPALKPFHWYKEHVLRGARENSLPRHYVAQIEQTASVSDPDPERHANEVLIYSRP